MTNKQSRKVRLLSIEPSASLRAALGRLCEESDLEADLCATVAEAHDRLHDGGYDLVITAAELPDGNPYDVLASVRGQGTMDVSPVLLLIARRSEHAVQEALDKGITEVFFKHDLDDLARYLEEYSAPGNRGKAPLPSALVVEDDRALGTFYKKLLMQHDFAVDYVPSGEAALRETERKRYDLILVDLVLAGSCSGIQFLRRLRQPGSDSVHAVAIAISAYDDEVRRLEALRAGANAFMTKPIDARELAARIAGMTRHATPGKPRSDRSGVATGMRLCQRCDPCQLTPREFNICTLVAAGYSDKRIAEEMAVSYWTVRTHIAHAFKKCQVSNRVELIRRVQGD